MANLAVLLDDAVRLHGGRTALIVGDDRITYAAIDEDAARFAGLLHEQGITPGDRVAILLGNGPDFIAAYYGALRIGAVVVPLNALLKELEVEQRLADSGARVLITPAERTGELQAAASAHGVTLIDPGLAKQAEQGHGTIDRPHYEPAVLLYTSGTTGGPKGAELTHAGMLSAAVCLAGPLLGLTADDVLLGAAPLAHIFGQTGVMNAAMVAGSSVLLLTRYQPQDALERMIETSTTVYLGVPTMVIGLLEITADAPVLPPFRVAHSGGAPLAIETLGAFTARFGCPMLEGYGLTETSGAVVTHHLGQETRVGSVGTPVEGAGLRIADGERQDVAQGEIGEVLVRGPALMRGYWRSPEATRAAMDEDGWFATGDMGYVDEDGYLFLVDRKKDVILRGAYNVYPREVEEILYQHPAVLEAAVVGVPDATLGEEVVAVVVPRPGTSATPDELKSFVRERIAAYKYPRLVVVAAELPRGPSGKILKRDIDRDALLAALLAARASDAAPAA